MDDADLIHEDHLQRVIGLLKASYTHLILDLSKSYTPLDQVALKSAKDVLLVTQLDLPCLRCCHGAPDRLVPGVEGQVEGSPMDREEPPRAQIAVGANGVFGTHVDVEPGVARAVGADLDEAQVERAPSRSPMARK